MKPPIWIVATILRIAFTIADTDEDQFSGEDGTRIFKTKVKNPEYFLSEGNEIFQFNIKNPKNSVTRKFVPEPTTKKQDPDLLYRVAVTGVIELFESQKAQINLTILHFNHVWGAEDEAVSAITAKLNSIKAFCDLKMNTLKAKLETDIPPDERSNMPLTWGTLNVIGRSWKEVERFIDKKIEEKPLTKAEEEELHYLRQWLKFSDQELVFPFDAMKDAMEKVFAAEPPREYTLKPSSSTVIRPFSIHYSY